MRPVKWKCRRITIFSIFLVILLFCYAYKHQNRVHSWMRHKVSEFAWENVHCKGVQRWNVSNKWPPVDQVSKMLRIKDKQSIFANGLGCGQWLDGLHVLFPSLKLFGVDPNHGSVKFVQNIVNGSFFARQPYDLFDIPIEDDKGFDHAITEETIKVLTKDQQCNSIKRMLPLLKPGGSLYIGSNVEECNPALVELNRKTGVNLLPDCFWSKECLADRTDVAEIIYIKEGVNFENPFSNPLLKDCTSSVYIYKHIMIGKQKDKKPLHPNLDSYKNFEHHHCTKSDHSSPHKANEKIKEGIKKAVKDMKLRGLDMH